MAIGNDKTEHVGASMRSHTVVSNTVAIDQHHPLFLQPNDTPGKSLISVKLTGSENHALWSIL